MSTVSFATPTAKVDPALQTLKFFLFVPDPVTTLAGTAALPGGYDRIVIERSDDNGATWAVVPAADGGLLVIEPTKCNYQYVISDAIVDPRDPSCNTFLRAFLRDSDSVNPDQTAVNQTGVDTSYEAVLSIEELKRIYLFGIDLTDDAGNVFPDELLAHYIRAAISEVEKEIDVSLSPRKYDEQHDFWLRDWENWAFVQLHHRPAISIEVYAVQYPIGNDVITFDAEWIRLDRWSGHVMVVPTEGTFNTLLVASTGSFIPLVLSGRDFIPQILRLQYTAGFELGAEGAANEYGLPLAIKEAVGMRASMGPFNIAGDLIVGAGIAQKSLSIDGLSTMVATTASATNAGFGARLGQYEKQLKQLMPKLVKHYRSSRMHIV